MVSQAWHGHGAGSVVSGCKVLTYFATAMRPDERQTIPVESESCGSQVKNYLKSQNAVQTPDRQTDTWSTFTSNQPYEKQEQGERRANSGREEKKSNFKPSNTGVGGGMSMTAT